MNTQPAIDTAPKLPTKFTVFGRVYELVPILEESESSVAGKVMAERAHELGANLGEEDAAEMATAGAKAGACSTTSGAKIFGWCAVSSKHKHQR